MKKLIAFSTFLAYVVLLGAVEARTNTDCDGPLVPPELIDQANFDICGGNYKFDSEPKLDENGIVVVPGIPAVGECAEFVWYDVPNCDPNGAPGPVKVEVCHTAVGTIKFTVTNGVALQVYVKGGPGGNLYDYCPGGVECDCEVEWDCGVVWDCNLVTPTNPNNEELYGLSNVQFCLKYDPGDDPICVNETAWSDGERFVNQGNWATFTVLNDDAYCPTGQTETLFAGQTKIAGTVKFKIVGEWVKIEIDLNDGFSFRGDESVKIQDYENLPSPEDPSINRSGNPRPGLFEWKFDGNTATICVPESNYYGVHVDLLHCFFE